MKKIPNPGSKEAQALGCTCPVLDNCFGKGHMGMKDLFVLSGDCPVHKLRNRFKQNKKQ